MKWKLQNKKTKFITESRSSKSVGGIKKKKISKAKEIWKRFCLKTLIKLFLRMKEKESW